MCSECGGLYEKGQTGGPVESAEGLTGGIYLVWPRGRTPEGASRFRRRAAMRRGSWEIAVEDAVGEPPRADGPLKSPHADRADGLPKRLCTRKLLQLIELRHEVSNPHTARH